MPSISGFTADSVDVDGRRIQYLSAGEGPAVVWMHGGGEPRPSRAHQLLSERFRVIALEMPKSQVGPELVETIVKVMVSLGVTRFGLWGTSDGAHLALLVALANSDAVSAIVLESPPTTELEQAMGALRIPVLMVFGSKDRDIPSGITAAGHLAFVYDAGHAVHVDRPEACSVLIADFLERGEQFVVNQQTSILIA